MKITRFSDSDVASTGSSGGPTGPAGGDLGGGYPNPPVTGIQGTPICTDTPVLNDVLTFDGTQWCPAPGGGSSALDVSDGVTTVTAVTEIDTRGAAVADLGSNVAQIITDVFDERPEVIQSKRYLMRDGTWRNPLLIGSGTFSTSSATTITDDTKYNAWPTIVKMRNGLYLLVYTKADSHHSDNTGKAVGKIGTEALDGTISWGTEFTIYDDPSVWVEAMGCWSLQSGRVIVTYFVGDFSTDPLDGAALVYSDDFGSTWSAPVIVNSTLTSYSYMSGPVVQLNDGTLRVTVEGKNSGDTFSRMVVLSSSDQGLTWGSQVTIATGTRNYYEGRLCLLDNETLLVLLRTTDANGNTYSSTSTDGGATWSTPAIAFAGHGQPNVIQASTGTLFAVTRENLTSGTGGVWVYTSTDRGATWSSATLIDGTMYEMEYGCPVEMYDGLILVVYGYQVTSSITNCDIKYKILTETTSTAGSVLTTKGDIYGHSTVDARIPVGADGTVLTADSTASLGVSYQTTAAVGPQHAHVNNVVFSGDGATTVFTLPVAPVDAYSVSVYVTAARSQDWTLSGALLDTLTFGSAPASATNNIVIDIVAVLA